MNKSYFYFLGFFLNSRKFEKKKKKDKAQNQNKINKTMKSIELSCNYTF